MTFSVGTFCQWLTAQQASVSKGSGSSKAGTGGNTDVYSQDGDYIKDIEVNDLRNRYTLTKGATQKMVNTSVRAY